MRRTDTAHETVYRAAESRPLPQGLAYEAASDHPVCDTAERLAGLR